MQSNEQKLRNLTLLRHRLEDTLAMADEYEEPIIGIRLADCLADIDTKIERLYDS